MQIGTPFLLLRLARVGLGLAALAGSADAASRIAFTPRAIQARVAEALRQSPDPLRPGSGAGPAVRVLASLHRP